MQPTGSSGFGETSCLHSGAAGTSHSAAQASGSQTGEQAALPGRHQTPTANACDILFLGSNKILMLDSHFGDPPGPSHPGHVSLSLEALE